MEKSKYSILFNEKNCYLLTKWFVCSMKTEHYSETAQFLNEIADRLRKLRGDAKL